MKVSNIVLANSVQSLQSFRSVKLPVKARYGLERAGRKIDAALEPFNAVRKELIEKYTVKGADVPEGQVQLSDPDAFVKEMNEIATIEVDLNLAPIPLSHFGDTQEPVEGAFAMLFWLIDGDN